MKRSVAFLAAAAVILAALPLGAIMMTPDIRQVPIERVLPNLERIAKENPSNPQPQLNLARLHVMAYALKREDIDVVFGPDDKRTTDLPYYPPGSTLPPAVRASPSAEHTARAADHLKRAIQHYDAALTLQPDNMTALLGRGWARQQSGDRPGAMADLRRVIATAWPQDSKTKMLMPSQRFITQEAIDYLVPLLDRQRDAAEIQDLMSKQTDLKNRPRAITPIAIPLDDDATPGEIVDRRARVRFDADGSALDREWTWITPRAGWLVYDADGRGAITSALQLFGNVTFWLFWSNGYDALAVLDDNGDGMLAGDELRHLAVWHDANTNGRSDASEVRPLAARAITALSFAHRAGDGIDVAAVSPRGVTFASGRTRPTYDVILHHAATATTLTRR